MVIGAQIGLFCPDTWSSAGKAQVEADLYRLLDEEERRLGQREQHNKQGRTDAAVRGCRPAAFNKTTQKQGEKGARRRKK